MDENAYTQMRQLQEQHWWWRGMRHVYRIALRRYKAGDSRVAPTRRVLDVGCGFGANLALLNEEAAHGGLVVGVDVSHEALSLIPRRPKLALVQAAADALPFRKESFDTVALLAVIEHVERDGVVLNEAYRVARPGALQLLLTSAFMLLWSHHDVANGHLRRYRVQQVKDLQRRAGWHILSARYANTLIFPLVALVRWLQRGTKSPHSAEYDMGPNPPLLRQILEGLLWLEALTEARIPFGVDIFTVCRKDDFSPHQR
jgi:SAM-dependent methyltransferase